MNRRVILVVPCYNEASRWNAQYWLDLAQIANLKLLFVDDGSTDGTTELMSQVSKALENTSVLHSVSNVGKAESIRRGFQYVLEKDSNSDSWIGFLDADGCVSVDEVARIIQLATDLVNDEICAIWTSRIRKPGHIIERKLSRHLIGRSIAKVLSFGRSDMPSDTQSGFKLFRPSILFIEVIRNPFKTRWLFEIEILERWLSLSNSQMKIHEEPLKFWRDIDGSKITLKQFPFILKEILIVKSLQMRN